MCTCIPSPDWSTQCEAISRKTGQRCPHNCHVRIPNTLASHNVMDGNEFCVHGRPVHLCFGHARSFEKRKRRGLTVKLIEGGYLSAFNRHGFGSVVQGAELPDLSGAVTMKVPAAWGVVACCGNVPDEVRRRLKMDGAMKRDKATCGACGGPLDAGRDAICVACTDEITATPFVDEADRLRAEITRLSAAADEDVIDARDAAWNLFTGRVNKIQAVKIWPWLAEYETAENSRRGN